MQNILLCAAVAAKQPCSYGVLTYKRCTLQCLSRLWICGFFPKCPLRSHCFLFLFLLLSSFIRRTKGKFLWENEVTAMVIEFTTQKKKSIPPFVF